jgi:uncharacterized protein YndB with AHSA1/START domain
VDTIMSAEYLRFPNDWVRVASTLPLPPAAVWSAITEPDRIARWLGDLAAPMRAGTAVRLDFGDGDFFDIAVDEVRRGEMVAFRWRFLGVGPESEVRWWLGTPGDGTTLTVDDRCPGRPASEAAQLRAGWLDFLDRLATYLLTGESARYRWRDVIDGGVDLPAGQWLPLRNATVTDWMPVAAESTQPRWFFIVDNDGPRRFSIRDWHLIADESVRFGVAVPRARTATRCDVQAIPTDD